MMEEDLLISIVLTTYNRSTLLGRAVSSVLNGEYRNIELIIVDDCSTDDTESIVTAIKDPRVIYKRLPTNRGVLVARNRGFDLATGDYITILDDDDELVPNALVTLTRQIKKNEHLNPDIFWFDCVDQESSKKSGVMPIASGLVEFNDYLCGLIYGDFWLVFSRDVLDGPRFNEELRAHESLFWLQLHRDHVAIYIPEVLCIKYREHGERLCDLEQRIKQLPQTVLALTEYLKHFGDDLKKLCPEKYGKKLAYLGFHQLLVNDFNLGRQLILASFKYSFSFKYLLLLIASYFLGAGQILRIYKVIEKSRP